VQDGRDYAARVAAALDGLIARHRVPAMIAVLIQSGGGDAQGSERGLEYDTVSGRYAEFVESEVLPRVTQLYDIRFTRNPEGRAAMGGSSGAAAAFSMAWFHPEWYRKVLSYSGTFVNQASPADPATVHGAWDYHLSLVPQNPRKPIRMWMEVGAKDLHWQDPETTYHNWPLANDRMAAALQAKGYDYRYVVAADAVHVDGNVVAQTLPGARSSGSGATIRARASARETAQTRAAKTSR
jgi:enterochelin esterase family protein